MVKQINNHTMHKKINYKKENKRDLFEQIRHSRTFSNIVEKFKLDEKSVLDIGCSEGHYLQCFGEGSVGVTIIEEHVKEAKKRNMHVVLKNIENPKFSMNKKFDIVWANNIFEHMNSPHLFLTKMREQLIQDGILILGVPIIPYFSKLTRLKKFRGAYAVSHVNFFTRKTLIETVRSGGWDVKEARLFYMKNSFLDSLFNLIAPHMYIIATPNPNFKYPKKRLLSLKGYKNP